MRESRREEKETRATIKKVSKQVASPRWSSCEASCQRVISSAERADDFGPLIMPISLCSLCYAREGGRRSLGWVGDELAGISNGGRVGHKSWLVRSINSSCYLISTPIINNVFIYCTKRS